MAVGQDARDIRRQQTEEALIRTQAEQAQDGMTDADLILQMHLIHWRLRLRSPATTAEKRAWQGIVTQLRRRFPGQPLVADLDGCRSSNGRFSPESCLISYLEFGSKGNRVGAEEGCSAVGESR